MKKEIKINKVRGRGKGSELTEVITSDLRALLFWAGVGVSRSRGGAYQNKIEEIIENYAEHLDYRNFASSPKFKK